LSTNPILYVFCVLNRERLILIASFFGGKILHKGKGFRVGCGILLENSCFNKK